MLEGHNKTTPAPSLRVEGSLTASLGFLIRWLFCWASSADRLREQTSCTHSNVLQRNRRMQGLGMKGKAGWAWGMLKAARVSVPLYHNQRQWEKGGKREDRGRSPWREWHPFLHLREAELLPTQCQVALLFIWGISATQQRAEPTCYLCAKTSGPHNREAEGRTLLDDCFKSKNPAAYIQLPEMALLEKCILMCCAFLLSPWVQNNYSGSVTRVALQISISF